MSRAPRVVALIAAHNEADVIAQVVGDLIAQGLSVHLIDDGSTDGTPDAAAAHLGRGLREIERRPPGARFRWGELLARKQELAGALDGDWFLHTDADELRESPWEGVPLARAFALVDALGYSAVDFAVFNFRPTDDKFRAGDELRAAFPFYESGAPFDRRQIKAWRRGAVDLVSSGGHDAQLDGRRVFPIRFVLRHYPIRGQAHGERKIFSERRPRFLDEERARGWHVQYDGVEPGARFIARAEELLRWDGEAVRAKLQIEHRDFEALREETAALSAETAALREADAGLRDGHARALAEADGAHRAAAARADRAEAEHARLDEERARLQRELDHAARRLDEIHRSRSWRWSSAARLAWKIFDR